MAAPAAAEAEPWSGVLPGEDIEPSAAIPAAAAASMPTPDTTEEPTPAEHRDAGSWESAFTEIPPPGEAAARPTYYPPEPQSDDVTDEATDDE